MSSPLTRFKHSLQAKLIAIAMVPLLATVLFAGIYFPLRQRSASLTEATNQVRTLSEMLAFSVGAGLQDGNLNLVQTAFEWAKKDKNVHYIAILDSDGAVLVSHDPEKLNLSAKAARQDGVKQQGELLVAAAPARSGTTTLGRIVIGYSLDETEAAIAASLWTSSAVNGLLLVAGMAVIYLFLRRKVKQLRDLEQAVRQVGGGNHDVVISVDSTDEIGTLASAFDQMAGELKASFAEVEQRTKAAQDSASEAEKAREEVAQQQQILASGVDRLLVAMEKLAAGDLTVALGTEQHEAMNRLFQGFNGVVSGLRDVLGEVINAAQSAAGVAAEIGRSSEVLATTARDQSQHADEVAAAVEETTRTIASNADYATRTADMARANGIMAREGSDVVGSTVTKIRQIAEVVHTSRETIERLGESSGQIGDIIGVIKEIADQTNLLALNASIEAARAGEHGRGFSVVADEVRKLAERTTTATVEIAGMIKRVQHESAEAVSAMQTGSESVNEGMVLADRAGETLSRVVTSSEEMLDMIGQIAAASEEQSATSSQIAASIEHISESSSSSAVGIQQITQSIQTLNGMTEGLRRLTARFVLESGSMRGAAPSSGDGQNGRPATLRGF